jgi:hypothetical protein
MKAINGNRIVNTTAIVLASLIFSSTNALAHEQTNVTTDEVGHGDSDSTGMRIDDQAHKRMILEESHEKRDSKKVDRFAHEARVQAAKYELNFEANQETIYMAYYIAPKHPGE